MESKVDAIKRQKLILIGQIIAFLTKKLFFMDDNSLNSFCPLKKYVIQKARSTSSLLLH